MDFKNHLKKIAHREFQKWAKSVEDSKEVSFLYSDGASFLPTMSSDFKKGKSGAKEYFSDFLKNKPVGKIINDEIQGNIDLIVHSGFYDFHLRETDEIVKARFTFAYQRKGDGGYEIIHHHSSIVPN